MATDPVIRFEGVRLGNPPHGAPALHPITHTVAPGEHCLVWAHSILWARPLLDAAMGLDEPDAGDIIFRGRKWEEMSVRELEESRAAIGRVSSGTAWLSNLDLDENILLPASYHRRRSLKESRARADKLAEIFGMKGLPHRRPEAAGKDLLSKAQWIRALLLEPDLLLLEFPTETADAASSSSFFEAVRREVRRGCGVVWITTDRRIWHRCAEEDVSRFRLSEVDLSPERDDNQQPGRSRP